MIVIGPKQTWSGDHFEERMKASTSSSSKSWKWKKSFKGVWTAEYSGDLKSDLAWILNGPKRGWVANGLNFEWDLKSAQPFEIWINGHNFVKNYLKNKNVRILNSLVFKWLGL